MIRLGLGLMLALGAPAAAWSDDGARGRALFETCTACHSRTPGQAGMAGPNLADLAGRLVGSDPDFDYSPALKAARARGLAWDAARIEAFLADPDEMFPGLWMSPPGVRRAEDRAAIAAYLMGAEP
ncbi:MAG: c-type cytochrome [Rhizobiales bacterium]|nr:c-type cytochrome [Hyphomicrobiales bacterium]